MQTTTINKIKYFAYVRKSTEGDEHAVARSSPK